MKNSNFPGGDPSEAPAEPAADTEPEAEDIPETYDPSRLGSVLRYYEAYGENISGSYAYLQLNTEGKKIWTAPLAAS